MYIDSVIIISYYGTYFKHDMNTTKNTWKGSKSIIFLKNL